MLQLDKYQTDAIKNMKTGCILCGGVGSGKSRTALTYYFEQNGGFIANEEDYTPMSDPPQDLYIITTAHKRDTLEWEGEMLPFLLYSDEDLKIYKHKVVVDSWNNIKKYENARGAFFIFDEQRVVGKGAWVKSFLKIAKANDWILLSATPGDTWSDYIPVFIANGFYKNRTDFISQHVIFSPHTKYPKIEKYYNTGKLLKFRNDILVKMDYSRPTEQHHESIYCEFDESLSRHIMKDRWNPFESKPIKNASELCYILRKICNTDITRIAETLDIIDEKKKVIIFYNFDYELDLLKEKLKMVLGDRYPIREWNGHRHQEIPKGDKWVYLVQYTAGAEGWNCTTTDTIIFFSQNYSYKIMIQAAGRIDRRNTPYKDLYYYHLKSRAPIDSAISRTLKTKEKFNETEWVGKHWMDISKKEKTND